MNAAFPALLLLSALGMAGTDLTIVVTQLPLDGRPEATASAPGRPGADCWDGARIVRVDPDGSVSVLTGGFAGACDADVSYDGKRMLFAGKRKAADPWDVFEMELTSGDVRRITRDADNCRTPVYQGSLYTIDREAPWYQITFASDAAGERDEAAEYSSSSLYTVPLHGPASERRRVTYNPSSDMDPAVLPDGRLVFASRQRATLDRGPFGRVALFAAQIDGGDYALFAGDEGRRIKRMPCVTDDRLVLFVESDEPTWDGAGRPATISLRRNLHSYRPVPVPGDAWYHSPSPLPGGAVLISRRTEDGDHGVWRLDPHTGEIVELFDDPAYHDVRARRIGPRPEPDGRSSVVSEKFATGRFYALNVYDSDLAGLGWVDPGEPLRLRVIEGLPLAPRSSLVPTRMLGELDVERDGSFNVELPANVPVQLQLIDGHGAALRTCGWIWVRNRETRGCIGCHEDPERAPENRFVQALTRPSTLLDLPPEQRRAVGFVDDVAPILAAKCASASCHAGGGVPPALEAPDATFRYLLGEAWVDPGRARTSRLVWQLLGSNLSRTLDATQGAEPPATMPPEGSAPLTPDEIRTIVEWIDLGGTR